MGKKAGIDRVLSIFTRFILPFAFLYAGVTRVSVVSFVYLCFFFILFSWGRGHTSFLGFLSPIVTMVISLGSIVLKACVMNNVHFPDLILILFGLCTKGHGSYVTILYFVADCVIFLVSLLHFILVNLSAKRKRHRRRRQELNEAIKAEIIKQPDSTTLSRSESETDFQFMFVTPGTTPGTSRSASVAKFAEEDEDDEERPSSLKQAKAEPKTTAEQVSAEQAAAEAPAEPKAEVPPAETTPATPTPVKPPKKTVTFYLGEDEEEEDDANNAIGSMSEQSFDPLEEHDDAEGFQDGEEDEEEESYEEEPRKRWHLVWNLTLTRSIAIVLAAAITGSFFPSILALPYILFCLLVILYLSIPRREHKKLSFPITVNLLGIFLAIYIFLHAAAVYAYQMYYNYNIFIPEYEGSSSSSDSMFESDILAVKEDTTVDVSNDYSNEYLGLFSYATFLKSGRWPVIVSYLLPFILYMIVAPVNRTFRRVTDEYAAARNEKFYEDSTTEVLVFLADHVPATDVGQANNQQGRSNAKMMAARALYPHAWKLAMFALICASLISGGLLMIALLFGVLIESVVQPYKAAKWATVLFFYYTVFIFLDYALNVPEPLILWMNENYPDLMRDLSFTYQEREFCGLFFGLQFWFVFILAMFIRLRNEYVLHHRLLKKISRSMRVFRKSELESMKQMSRVAAASAIFTPIPSMAGDLGDSSDDETTKSFSEMKDDAPSEVPQEQDEQEHEPDDGSAAKTFEQKMRAFRGQIHMLLIRLWETVKSLLTRLVISLIRYSYIVSLIFLYFVSIRGINAINFMFMLFFLLFAAKPTLAKRSWKVLVHFSQAILLLRFIWQLDWMPEDTTATNIIGLSKDRDHLPISTLVWEALLVIFVTIQMYIINIEEETLARERSRKFALSSEDEAPVVKESANDSSNPAGDAINPQELLASMSKENELPLLDKVVNVILVWVRTRGLFICVGAWMLMGILMPISIVSLSFVLMAMLGTVALYFAKTPAVYMQRLWIAFMIWFAVVLFAEYSFQLPDLHTAITEAYKDTVLNNYITIDELGLVKLSSSQIFVGMLPYILCFVIAIMQWNFFSLTREETTVPDGTVPKPLLGILDFLRRFVFVYLPFITFLFAAAHFIMYPSAVRFVFLFVILFSRVAEKGFDRVGGFIVVLSNAMIVITLIFNMHALDFAAEKYPTVFKWIGLPRQYIYSDTATNVAHTEIISMTYEYIVLVIFLLIQHLSLRWGEDVADHIHSAAAHPRAMPLFSFLDKYPTWNEARKDRHPWHGFLYTLCNLPNLLTRQTCYFFLCLMFYLRSSTLMGLWYLVAFVVCCNCNRELVRRIGRPYLIVDIILILGQYFVMLGLPNTDPWPWVHWSTELQRWLLLYVPYDQALIFDIVMLYFLSSALHMPETSPDVYSIITASHDDMTFLLKPRSALNEFRYIFLHFSVVIMMLVVFFVATSKACVISLAFLIGTIILMYKGDFLLLRTRPWNIMAICLYVMCFLQIIFQVIIVLMNQFSGDRDTIDTVIYIAGFLGISFTTPAQLIPDEATGFLFGLMLLLAIMRSMMKTLAHEFYVTRMYTAEMRVLAQLDALAYMRHSINSVIEYIENVFSDRQKRRERLEALRESRKRKQLLFPDLVAEIEDDGSSSCGGSYLSAEEARYKKNDLVVDTKEKKKLTFKERLQAVGASIQSAWFWCIDHIIYWLHGKEGQVEGAHYAKDLKILHEEWEQHKQKKIEAALEIEPEADADADETAGTGTMLTEEALQELSASLNARDFTYYLAPHAEQLRFTYEVDPMRDFFPASDLMLSQVCHMNVGTKIGKMNVINFVKRLRLRSAGAMSGDDSSTPTTPVTPVTPNFSFHGAQPTSNSVGDQLCKIAASLAPEDQNRKYTATDIVDMNLAQLCYVVHECVHESRQAHSLAKHVTVRDFFVHLCHLFIPVTTTTTTTTTTVDGGDEEKQGSLKNVKKTDGMTESFFRRRRDSVYTAVVDTREDSDSAPEDDDANRSRDLYFGREALLLEANSSAFQFDMAAPAPATPAANRPRFLVWQDSRKKLLDTDKEDHDSDDSGVNSENGGGFGGGRTMPKAQEAKPADDAASKKSKDGKEEYKRRSRARLFWVGLTTKVETSTETICLIAFVLNHLLHGSLVSLIYVLFGFCYVALAKRPSPRKKFWNFIMIYTSVIVLLKFIVKLPGVCLCRTEVMHIWSFSYHMIFSTTSVQCPEDYCLVDSGASAEYFSLPYLLGVVPSTESFWGDVVMDIIVLLAVAFHRLVMDKQGLWTEKMEHERAMENARFLKRKNELLSTEYTASPTHVMAIRDVEGKNEHFLSFKKDTLIRVISRGRETGANSIGEIDGHTGLFDLSMTKPAPLSAVELTKDGETLDEELGFNSGPGELGNDDHPEKKKKKKKSKNQNGKKKNGGKKGKKKDNGFLAMLKETAVVKFYTELLNDSTHIGSDYYAAMFTIEFVCLVYLLLFGASFTGSQGSLIEYISQSYIPGLYVFLLILQFTIIILDRIIYICHSMIWKIVMQYVSVVGFSLIMMWWFPSNMEMSVDLEAWHSPFTQSSSLQFFFVLKCVYWFVSALQIRDGYPLVSGDRFLMRHYNTYSNWGHMAYRVIPFLYELRTILDWTFIPTTLDFFDYLRVEDIYADVYRVACLAASRTPRKPGSNRSCGEKCGMGCSLFLLMAAVLWLPLIILTSALPGVSGVDIIPVTSASMRIQLHGYAPLYSTDLTNVTNNPPVFLESDFKSLRMGRSFITSDMETVQPIEFPSYSSTLWKIPYASKAQLAQIFDKENVTIEVTLMFERESSSNSEINITFKTELDANDRKNIAQAMRTGLGASTTLTNIIPRFLKMPGSSGDVTTPCNTSSKIIGTSFTDSGNSTDEHACVPITVNFTYHGCFEYGCAGNETPADYWSISQVPENISVPEEYKEMANEYFDKSDVLQLILLHVPVSMSSNVIGTIAAYGLIGIYATIILAIARFIRNLMSGQTDDVMFICLPDPMPLVRLSKDIILARVDGDLLLEEQLANEIIQIYRSPEALIENTRMQVAGSVGGDNGGDAEKGGFDDDADDDD